MGVEGWWLVGRDGLGFRCSELEGFGLVGTSADLPVLFVDEVMVAAAQEDEVLQVGGAAVGPVHEVVGVEADGAGASGGSAVPVAVLQQSEQILGDGPGPAAELERDTATSSSNGLADGVARQTSCGVVRDGDTGFAGVEVGAGRGRVGMQ